MSLLFALNILKTVLVILRLYLFSTRKLFITMQIVELDYTPLCFNIPVLLFVCDLYTTVSAVHGQCCDVKHSSLAWPVALSVHSSCNLILKCAIINYYRRIMVCIIVK